jgi:hypothetical protein
MNSRTLWNLLMKRQIKSSTLPPSGLSQSSLLTMWRNLLLISGKNTEESAEKKSHFDGPFYNLYWTAVEATERKERESAKE